MLFPNSPAVLTSLFVCVLAPVLLVSLQVHSNGKFSAFDEAAHLDYVERMSGGEIPRQGQKLLESSMREISCNGYQGESFDHLPDCSSPARAWSASMRWNQHEAQQPPTYYAITVPLRRISHFAFGSDNDLRATRITSIGWLIVGLVMLWGAGRLMSLSPILLGAVLLILVSSPWILFLSATVSNDVTAVPAAGLVALAGALVYRYPERWGAMPMFAAGFMASSLKTTNILATAAIATLLAVAAFNERLGHTPPKERARAWVRTGGALLGGALAATAIWAVVHDSIALIDVADDPALDALRDGPRSVGTVLKALSSLVWPLTGDSAVGMVRYYSPDTFGHDIQAPFHAMLGAIPIAVGLSALFVSRREWPHVLGLISMALLSIGGLFGALGLMLLYDQEPDPTSRYGISLAPLLVLAFGAAVTGRWAGRGLTTFAVLLFTTTVIAMVS